MAPPTTSHTPLRAELPLPTIIRDNACATLMGKVQETSEWAELRVLLSSVMVAAYSEFGRRSMWFTFMPPLP